MKLEDYIFKQWGDKTLVAELYKSIIINGKFSNELLDTMRYVYEGDDLPLQTTPYINQFALDVKSTYESRSLIFKYIRLAFCKATDAHWYSSELHFYKENEFYFHESENTNFKNTLSLRLYFIEKISVAEFREVVFNFGLNIANQMIDWDWYRSNQQKELSSAS